MYLVSYGVKTVYSDFFIQGFEWFGEIISKDLSRLWSLLAIIKKNRYCVNDL